MNSLVCKHQAYLFFATQQDVDWCYLCSRYCVKGSSMLKKMRLFLLLGLGSLVLLGCGQKSALFRAPPQDVNQAATDTKSPDAEPKQSEESKKD